MNRTTPLLIFCAGGLLAALAALGACTPKPQGLFADTSPPVSVSRTADSAGPRFMGRWNTGDGQCRDPMVIQASALHDGTTNCEFAKVESSSAGYSISAVCHAGKGSEPGRLTLTLPDPAHVDSMTLAGGPFKTPVALNRCAA